MNESVQIVAVTLHAQGVELAYTLVPTDHLENGLAWEHSVAIPRGSDYDQELEAFDTALLDLVESARYAIDRVPTITEQPEEEEEDES